MYSNWQTLNWQQQLTAIWNVLDKSAPLANFLTFIGFFGPLCGGVTWYVRNEKFSLVGEIRDLKDDLKRREQELSRVRTSLSKAEESIVALESRLPESALKKSEKEMSDRNYEGTNRALATWSQEEGGAISQLMLRRAEWASATAFGEGEKFTLGVIAAKAYAIAALSFCSLNRSALGLLTELDRLSNEITPTSRSIKEALSIYEERAFQPPTQNLRSDADSAEAAALHASVRGLYYIALTIVERALNLRSQVVGVNDVSTLRVQVLKAQILNQLGRPKEALSTAESVLKVRETNPSLVPALTEVLIAARYVVAQSFANLGRGEEALSLAASVAKDYEGSSEFGPKHRRTLEAHLLVARILTDSKRPQPQALSIAESIVKTATASPAIGPADPLTLVARFLVARILSMLGRGEDALPLAVAVAKDEEQHPLFGPMHPHTLSARHLIAWTLFHLGRATEALPIAIGVAKDEEANPALGPTHRFTLGARYLVAEVLTALGRAAEALPIARSVAEMQENSPALGPTHPDTLDTHRLITRIINNGRS